MTSPNKQTVVVADPDSDFLAWVEKHLAAPSIEILTTSRSDEALSLFEKKQPDVLVSEIRIAPIDGLELLKRVRSNHPNAVVLLNTAFPSTNAVIEATRLGAYDVLRKESMNFDLRPTTEAALQAAEQIKRATVLTDREKGKERPPNRDLIVGGSPAMQDVYKLIGRVARSDVPVLITGESGSGKEVVANAVHKYSQRANADYVAINCAAIPGNLLESELFGHEKGAFTGAIAQRMGRFEQCDGGTLFLDEIGEMPLEVQSKLLRVLQSGEFSRVGGNQTQRSSVRILAATNKNLEDEVVHNRFREDLFYRLNVVRIHIPPLRQRREDIRLLAEFFLQRISDNAMGRKVRLSDDAHEILEEYDWPGNVRELENTIQRACVLATGNVLLAKDLPLGQSPRRSPAKGASKEESSQARDGASPAASLEQALASVYTAAKKGAGTGGVLSWVERQLIRLAMDDCGDSQVKASKQLGMTRATLRKRLEQFELEEEKAEATQDA